MLLPLLNPYVDAFLCMALALLLTGIFYSLVPVFQRIPVVGGSLASFAKSMGQAIIHGLGVVFGGLTGAVGDSFHAVARFIDHTYLQFRSHAVAILEAATLLGAVVTAVHALRLLVHRAVGSVGALAPRVKTLEREWHGIEHRVKTLERKVAQGIGHDLRIRIKALEQEYTGLRDKVIPDIRSIARGAETEVQDLRKWVTDNVPLIGTAAFAGAIAAALSTLGLGWLRCNSNPFNNNRNACGLWGDLADVLALVVAAELALNFEDLVREAQGVAEVTTVAIQDVFGLNG